MIDPYTGADVYARYMTLPKEPETGKLLPARPNPRMLKRAWDGDKPVVDVLRLVDRILQSHRLIDEYFSMLLEKHATILWRDVWSFDGCCYHTIAVYAVSGTSEGHYVHIELLGEDAQKKPARLRLAEVKTFQGMAHAQKIANLAAILLGA